MSALRDWIAYQVVMVIPGWRGGMWERLMFWLLPYAGSWAYRDEHFPADPGDSHA